MFRVTFNGPDLYDVLLMDEKERDRLCEQFKAGGIYEHKDLLGAVTLVNLSRASRLKIEEVKEKKEEVTP